jgi:hypothetical protein
METHRNNQTEPDATPTYAVEYRTRDGHTGSVSVRTRFMTIAILEAMYAIEPLGCTVTGADFAKTTKKEADEA